MCTDHVNLYKVLQSLCKEILRSNMNSPLIQDGTTSVALDTSLLRTVTGLDFTGLKNTVETLSEGLFAGFDITQESNFKFDTENGFTPLEGEIKHTGTLIFDTPVGEVTVGGFSIGFDAERQTDKLSGFFVQNTVEGAVAAGAILFDVSTRGILAVEGTELSLSNTDLLVSPELAQFLLDTGLAADDLTGADVGDTEISAVTGDLEEKVTDTDLALVQDGTTSVALDVDSLTAAAGLTLKDTENTVEPVSEDFAVGFDISEESDFKFSAEDGFAPVEGEIEHTGTVTFGSAAGDIIVGDFTVGFDAERQTDDISGFFVQNTVEGAVPDGAILFDVSNPESLEITDTKLNLGSADLLVASEFAQILLDTGLATDNLTGADVGDVAINAITESDF